MVAQAELHDLLSFSAAERSALPSSRNRSLSVTGHLKVWGSWMVMDGHDSWMVTAAFSAAARSTVQHVDVTVIHIMWTSLQGICKDIERAKEIYTAPG